jgi:hypothetical protein
MKNIIERLFVEPFQNFYENILQYLTNIMSFAVIFLAGLLLALILKLMALHFFRLIKVDALSERAGVTEMLGKGGIREPVSSLVSRLVGWITIAVFFIIALSALAVPEVEHLLRTFFLYLPNVVAAVVILFVGYLLSNFLGRASLIAAVNADIRGSRIIGRLVKLGVFLLAVTMALEQLGLGKDTIIVTFAIIFGGVVLALSLAFGIGGQEAARKFLEKKFNEEEHVAEGEQDKDDEITHV